MNHQLEQSRQRFQVFFEQCLKTAQHIPSERQTWEPEAKGRTAKGIYEHLAAANFGFAKIIQGEEIRVDRAQRQSVAMPAGNFAEAVAVFKKSGDAVLGAMRQTDPAKLDAPRTLPWGDPANVAAVMDIVGFHQMYHLGQLNYLQTLWGDAEDRL